MGRCIISLIICLVGAIDISCAISDFRKKRILYVRNVDNVVLL